MYSEKASNMAQFKVQQWLCAAVPFKLADSQIQQQPATALGYKYNTVHLIKVNK